MRYSVILICLLVLAGCKSSQVNTVPATEKKAFKGDWIVSSVNVDGRGQYRTTLLGSISGVCMQGSQWSLVSNNNRGSFELTGADCAQGNNPIVWDYDATRNVLLIKPTDERYKSETGTGYRFAVANLTENSFELQQAVNTGNDAATLRILFNRQ